MNGVQMNKQTSYQQKTGSRFRSPFQFFGSPLIFDMGTVAKEGYSVTPTATAAYLTMNREGIRRLAAEQLGLPTSQ